MNKFQQFGFFISMGYMFYVLWWNYNYQNFFNTKRLLINLSITICWASFGLVTDYSVQTGSFLIPITLIFFIRIFDLLSIKIRRRHFRPCSGKGILLANATIIDALLTLVLIVLNVTVPIMILNFVINGKALN